MLQRRDAALVVPKHAKGPTHDIYIFGFVIEKVGTGRLGQRVSPGFRDVARSCPTTDLCLPVLYARKCPGMQRIIEFTSHHVNSGAKLYAPCLPYLPCHDYLARTPIRNAMPPIHKA